MNSLNDDYLDEDSRYDEYDDENEYVNEDDLHDDDDDEDEYEDENEDYSDGRIISIPTSVDTSWGTHSWNFLYASIYGSYPKKIDKNNESHKRTKKQFKIFLFQLRYTLPCNFCKRIFKQLWEEIPIDNYLRGRNLLINWVYKIQKNMDNIYRPNLDEKQVENYLNNRKELKMKLDNNNISKNNCKKIFKSLKGNCCSYNIR